MPKVIPYNQPKGGRVLENTTEHIIGQVTMPNQAEFISNREHLHLSIQPTGVLVKLDCNPISKYNHAINLYREECNRIEGIQLISICNPCAISWFYDCFIYFYEYFLMVLFCQVSNQTYGIIWTLIMMGVYFVLLFCPYISVITFCVTCSYFLFYCAAVIVRSINVSRLGSYEYTHNMVPAEKAPPFETKNQFFLIKSTYVRNFFQQKGNILLYDLLQQRKSTQFMAYKQCMITDNYQYLVSCKMVAFHLMAVIVSILGLVGSINIFKDAYGRE